MFCAFIEQKRFKWILFCGMLILLNYDLLFTRSSAGQNEAISGVVIAVTRVKLCLSEAAGSLCRIGLWTMALSAEVLFICDSFNSHSGAFFPPFYISIYQFWGMKSLFLSRMQEILKHVCILLHVWVCVYRLKTYFIEPPPPPNIYNGFLQMFTFTEEYVLF